MKPFPKFLLIFLSPLLLIEAIALLITGNIDTSNLRTTFLTIVFFGTIAAYQVFYFDSKIRNGVRIFQSLALTSLLIFTTVIGSSVISNFLFGIDLIIYVPIFQGILMVCLFYFSVFMTIAFRWRKQNKDLQFNEKPIFYFKTIFGISATVSILLFTMTSDRFFLNKLDFRQLLVEVGLIITRVSANTLVSFFVIVLLSKIRFVKSNLLILIILVSLIMNALNITAFGKWDGFLFWTMKYYLILLFIILCHICVIIYRNNSHTKSLKLKKLAFSFSKKEAEYIQLKNQINPHFLFNNLNVLISFIETQPQKAIDFGHHLSNVYRHYLKNDSEDFVDLENELLFIKEYLEIYNAKFDSGFTFEIENLKRKGDFILSSTLQETIDNIFKHNIPDAANPLRISIYLENDALVISNSVNPKNVFPTTGIGLTNIAKRYELLTNSEIQVGCEIEKFIVKLPLIKSEP